MQMKKININETWWIFAYFLSKKTKGAWFTEVERNLQEVGITQKDIQEREPLKKKLTLEHIWVLRENLSWKQARTGLKKEKKMNARVKVKGSNNKCPNMWSFIYLGGSTPMYGVEISTSDYHFRVPWISRINFSGSIRFEMGFPNLVRTIDLDNWWIASR